MTKRHFYISVAVLFIGAVLLLPVSTIWAINTLFETGIELAANTYIAITVLILIVAFVQWVAGGSK